MLARVSLVPLAIVLMLFGCTSESFQFPEARKDSSRESLSSLSKNHPPTIRSARILPDPVLLNQVVVVNIDGLDSDVDLITYNYQWWLNGEALKAETHQTVDPKTFKRGDRISVDVIPYDGHVKGLSSRLETVVGNTPPMVSSLLVEPDEVRIGSTILAEAAAIDADQDPIEYRFRWWRNNSEVVDGDLHELDTAGFAKGDTIVVEVTPSDPTSKGKSKISKPIMILNSAPTITSAPPSKIDKGRFIYAVVANDPDGDPLTYALEVAPSGMKIDKGTGRIEWSLTGKLAGNHKVRVTATDGEQGKAFQEFDLTFSAPVSSSRLGSPKNFRLNTRLVSPFPALLE
jgi:hypothetical protein